MRQASIAGQAVGLLWLMLSSSLAFGYSADSLGSRALEGDWAGWNEALEMHRSDLRPGINGGVWSVFAWPVERRPLWARQSDTAMWALAQTCAPAWKYASDGQVFAVDSAKFIQPAPPRPPLTWLWWSLLGGSMLMLAFPFMGDRARLRPLSPDLAPIDEALKHGRVADSEALAAWRALSMSLQPEILDVEAMDWGDVPLTGTEQEVVLGLLRGWSAEETALSLVCTPSHVYNVRSQIRKKLDLSPNEDLERHLRKRFLRTPE